MWSKIAPKFYKTHKVITLDFPGHGKSEILSDAHTMELFAEMVISLLDHLRIEKTTLIGHSMGGYVAMAILELCPQKIEKLVLLNATPAEDSQERKENRERALQLVPKVKDAFITMAIGNLFTETHKKKFASKIETLKKEALSMTTEAIVKTIKGMKDRKDHIRTLKDFSKPKFMICGIADPILPIQECKKIAESTNSKLFELEGGHMSHLENFNILVKILHFIEKNGS